MTNRELDAKVSVSPQIIPDDMVALRNAGVTALICNRPDTEVPENLSAANLADAATGLGMSFSHVPLAAGGLSVETIRAHLDAMDAAEGRVLAYCASGTRSAYLWAFAMALGDRLANDDIIGALDRAGYPAPGLAPQLDQVRSLGP